MTDDRDDPGTDAGEPIDDLADFRLDPDPDLPGRVQRDINRRILVADALDLGFNGLLEMVRSHVLALLEMIGVKTSANDEGIRDE